MATEEQCLEIAAAYLRDTLGLDESQYRLGLRGIDRDTGLTVVFAVHVDDLDPQPLDVVGAGGGKTRILLVDRVLDRVDRVLVGQ